MRQEDKEESNHNTRPALFWRILRKRCQIETPDKYSMHDQCICCINMPLSQYVPQNKQAGILPWSFFYWVFCSRRFAYSQPIYTCTRPIRENVQSLHSKEEQLFSAVSCRKAAGCNQSPYWYVHDTTTYGSPVISKARYLQQPLICQTCNTRTNFSFHLRFTEIPYLSLLLLAL